jgi:hypothetical protein
VVTISTGDSAAEEGTDDGSFVVSRDGNSEGELAVALVWSGDAEMGEDFTVSASAGDLDTDAGILILPDGVGSAVLTITPNDDDMVEGSEDVVVTVASGDGYEVGQPASAVIHIADNDNVVVAPTVSITCKDVIEGKKGAEAVVTISLSEASTEPITVTLMTLDGTAEAGSDYVAVFTTITFEPGVTEMTYTIRVLGDKKAEEDEWFTVGLSDPVGALLYDDPTDVITIFNDD